MKGTLKESLDKQFKVVFQLRAAYLTVSAQMPMFDDSQHDLVVKDAERAYKQALMRLNRLQTYALVVTND